MSNQRIQGFTEDIKRLFFEVLNLKKDKVECKHCLFEILVAWNYAVTDILYDAFRTEHEIEDFLNSVAMFCEIEMNELYQGRLN
jgi:hypothetical protein